MEAVVSTSNRPKRWPKVFTLIGRIIIFFWVSIFVYFFYLMSPFISSMYSITKIPNTYFEVKLTKNLKATYKQVGTMPADWVPLEKISKRLRGAIISSEDGKFFTHPGYDIEELQDAINDGVVKKKKKIRGASTITQQLIKNIYFTPEHSFWRKTKEMGLTLWIEDYVDKNKIRNLFKCYRIRRGTLWNKKGSKLLFQQSSFCFKCKGECIFSNASA
jgi:membrane peptidoglycan carboxypeptidase